MTVPNELWEMRFGLLGMLKALNGPAVDTEAFSRYAIHLFGHAETLGHQKTPSPAKRRGQKLTTLAASWMVTEPAGQAEALTPALTRELRLLDAIIERCAHQICSLGETVGNVDLPPPGADYPTHQEAPLTRMGEIYFFPVAGE